ncbi:MAG: Lrp/AsnC ligand binding domain-containing protein [Candidatus Thermoplasmatota archaeon]|nr:Lrp/AsnC ligand binding domain-containing protein [Candidatus Thermoplasmatota archaeon]
MVKDQIEVSMRGFSKPSMINEDSIKYVTPLYATQSEGMMSVGVIFDVKDPDNIAHFLTENITKCYECHHTKTISLMKPVFFPIPKNRPKNIYRYIIRIYTHPRYYKSIYNFLVDYKYPFNLFPIYISYSLGDEDIMMNVAADSPETVNNFVREKIRNLEGADSVLSYLVVKAKRFAPLEKLIEEQQKHLAEKAKKIPKDETDKSFDWVEDFEEYALLTGALPGDL